MLKCGEDEAGGDEVVEDEDGENKDEDEEDDDGDDDSNRLRLYSDELDLDALSKSVRLDEDVINEGDDD